MLQGIASIMIGRNTNIKGPVIASFNTNSNTASATITNTVTAPANTWLFLTAASADDTSITLNGSLVSSPVLTWSKLVQSKALSSGNTEIWAVFFPAGGSITTTYTGAAGTASSALSSVLYSMTGVESTLGGASNSAVNQSNPSVAVTTGKVQSIIFCVSSDWGANDGTVRAYRDNATETKYHFVPTQYTAYHYYKQTTSIALYTEGITTPTSATDEGTSILEVRGVVG